MTGESRAGLQALPPYGRAGEEEPEAVPDRTDKPLSLWYWVVPTVLVVLFVAIFLVRHPARPYVPVVIAEPVESTLPDLGAVRFEPGQPGMSIDGQATLDRAVQAMRGNPNVGLRVEGVTDAKGHPRFRDALSEHRALAVGRYLENNGIDSNRMTVGALGRSGLFPTGIKVGADARRAELFVR